MKKATSLNGWWLFDLALFRSLHARIRRLMNRRSNLNGSGRLGKIPL